MKEFNKCPKKWLPTPLSPKNPYAPHGVEPCRRDYETRLDRLGDVAPDGEVQDRRPPDHTDAPPMWCCYYINSFR